MPSGIRKKYSGSIIAAPQVTNLAAKILAIKPQLTPKEVKDLIIKYSDKNTEGYSLIHPKKTIASLKVK